MGFRWPYTRAERVETRKVEPLVPYETRLTAVESAMQQLVFDWESVLSKISNKVARDAARERRKLVSQLDADEETLEGEIGAQGADGTPPQVGSQEWRAAQKAQLRQRAAVLNRRNG